MRCVCNLRSLAALALLLPAGQSPGAGGGGCKPCTCTARFLADFALAAPCDAVVDAVVFVLRNAPGFASASPSSGKMWMSTLSGYLKFITFPHVRLILQELC